MPQSFRKNHTFLKRNFDTTMHDLAVTVVMHQMSKEDRDVSTDLPPRALQSEVQWRSISRKLASKVNDQMWGHNVDLSSHLSINLPCNGEFSAELDLKKIKESKKEIILHVCRKRIDVFYRKKEKESESQNNISTETCELYLEDLILKGHVYLPMFIDADTYEFSLDDSRRLHITAAIQGAIQLHTLPSNGTGQKKKKLPLIKSLSDCSLYLRKKISKRARIKSDSYVILGKQAMGKKSVSVIEDMKNLGDSTGSQKSSSVLIPGSTTVKGVFKPFQLLNKGSKRRFAPGTCRWEICMS